MKIAMAGTENRFLSDIRKAFEKAGCESSLASCELTGDTPFTENTVTEETREAVLMAAEGADAVFTLDFYPWIADLCVGRKILYLSWIYHYPAYSLYSVSMVHETNRVFTADPDLAALFQSSGIGHVFYLPYAVDPDRFREIRIDDLPFEKPNISYVGEIGMDKKDAARALFADAKDSTQGYLDGLAAAQCGLYGANIMEEPLPDYIMADLKEVCPIPKNDRNVAAEEWIYSQYLMLPLVTLRERLNALFRAGAVAKLHIFSGEMMELDTGEQYHTVPDDAMLPKIFAATAVNLVIPDRTVHGTILPEVFEILASGGLLFAPYQSDLLQHFEHQKELALYTNYNEYVEGLQFYLANPAERNRIASEGRKIVLEHHTYDNRIGEILKVL